MAYLGTHHYHPAPQFTYQHYRLESGDIFQIFERRMISHCEWETYLVDEVTSYDEVVEVIRQTLDSGN